MVNGVKMVFKKELMMRRIQSLDLGDLVSEAELKIMDNLDGQEVSTASWERTVKGAPVYACVGKDGDVYNVFEGDCVVVA